MIGTHLIGLSQDAQSSDPPTWMLFVGAALVGVGLYVTTRRDAPMKANGRRRRGRGRGRGRRGWRRGRGRR